jgi:hypothetical protein
MTILKFGCQVCGQPHTITRALQHYRLCADCDQRIREQIAALVEDNPKQHVFNYDTMFYFLIELRNYDSAQCMVQPKNEVERREDQQYIFDFEGYLQWCADRKESDR